ncbi:MAG: magnesium chelatase domain-containing protein, partial [Deltaproteobacteria bacterium]|nr:magnesium chelatase domain-containing protein [Deltaproteobacteria bacterium]
MERSQSAAGSAVVASLEGTRPLLMEIQALVSHSGLANPRRTSIGIDSSRVSLLVAVLEKIVGLHLSDQDIFVNVAGGLKIQETALDLGCAAAIFSSFHNKPLDPNTILIGEIGLTGEIRAVSRIEARLNEAEKLGFKKAFIPKGNASKKLSLEKIDVTPVAKIADFFQGL